MVKPDAIFYPLSPLYSLLAKGNPFKGKANIKYFINKMTTPKSEGITIGVKTLIAGAVMIVIGVIVFSLFLKGCSTGAPVAPIVTVVHDSSYKTTQSPSPIQTQPTVISVQPPSQPVTNTIREIIYKNDTTAIRQLLERFYSQNNYSNVLKIDSIGTVTVTDTISENEIKGRSYTYNLRYPVITNTTTIREQYKPVNQLYLGGGVIGNQLDLVSAFKAGILIKNKKDAVFELNATINKGMAIGAEIGFYKKISFRKQNAPKKRNVYPRTNKIQSYNVC